MVKAILPPKRRKRRKIGTLYIELDKEMADRVRELADTQTLYSGQKCTINELVRGAIAFTFDQNEVMREFFRRRKKQAKTRLRF